jgi:hypothetical protein
MKQTPWSTVFFEKLTVLTASQEFSHHLWNQEVHCCVHQSQPLVPILSQINPVHVLNASSLRPILILFSYLLLGLPSGFFCSGIPTKTLYSFLISPMRYGTHASSLNKIFIWHLGKWSNTRSSYSPTATKNHICHTFGEYLELKFCTGLCDPGLYLLSGHRQSRDVAIVLNKFLEEKYPLV